MDVMRNKKRKSVLLSWEWNSWIYFHIFSLCAMKMAFVCEQIMLQLKIWKDNFVQKFISKKMKWMQNKLVFIVNWCAIQISRKMMLQNQISQNVNIELLLIMDSLFFK